jgi:L-ribulokinase
VGALCSEWAEKVGLREGIAIATPIVDAQSSVAAAGFEDGKAVLVLGTSAVLVMNTDKNIKVEGVLSNGFGSAAPEMFTLESSLAAMGDLFAWFVDNCVPEDYLKKAAESNMNIHSYLTSLCKDKAVGENGLIALDWWNGNRCVIPNDRLSGLIVGLRLSTPPEDIYRALIESCAYGIRRICENCADQGVEVSTLAATGGIALKNEMMMQILADVLNMPIEVLESAQSAALGAAVYDHTRYFDKRDLRTGHSYHAQSHRLYVLLTVYSHLGIYGKDIQKEDDLYQQGLPSQYGKHLGKAYGYGRDDRDNQSARA